MEPTKGVIMEHDGWYWWGTTNEAESHLGFGTGTESLDTRLYGPCKICKKVYTQCICDKNYKPFLGFGTGTESLDTRLYGPCKICKKVYTQCICDKNYKPLLKRL
jgi:hypothetical protein